MATLDYDAIVIGSGPAGLTAGSHLAQAGRRTLVLERDVYGGALQHVDWIDDYPPYPQGISGADLASALLDTATGVTLEQADVTGVEVFSRSRWVATNEGRGFSCGVVILAGGARFSSLGLPAERRLRGRGVIDCTPCDAGFYAGKPVVVVGSGDYALRDALHLASMGARVTLLCEADALRASPRWQSAEHDDIEVRYKAKAEAILGEERVEGVAYTAGARCEIPAAGIAVRMGIKPNTEWLADLLELDSSQRVPIDAQFETEMSYVLAAGDIRSGTPLSVASAIADGSAAAARAIAMLMELG